MSALNLDIKIRVIKTDADVGVITTFVYVALKTVIDKTFFISCANNKPYDNEFSFDRKIIDFIGDSGATEHMTNSRLFFSSPDSKIRGIMKCINKDSRANIKNGRSRTHSCG